MAIDRERARQCLKAFDFLKLFIEELGWDRFSRTIIKEIEGLEYRFHGVAEKRGVAVLVADSIPDYAIRVKLDKLIAKDHFEHLIVLAIRRRDAKSGNGYPCLVTTMNCKRFGLPGLSVCWLLKRLAFSASRNAPAL